MPKTPYGVFVSKWVVFRNPASVLPWLRIKSKNLPFIEVGILGMVGPGGVVILTGPHISNTIEKVWLPVQFRNHQPSPIIVIATGNCITDVQEIDQGFVVKMISIADDFGLEMEPVILRVTAIALPCHAFILVYESKKDIRLALEKFGM